ncbi:MAG: TonB-dependent receptor [Vicinamibacterales bacterium]
MQAQPTEAIQADVEVVGRVVDASRQGLADVEIAVSEGETAPTQSVRAAADGAFTVRLTRGRTYIFQVAQSGPWTPTRRVVRVPAAGDVEAVEIEVRLGVSEQVVVSATRSTQSIDAVAASVSVVSSDDFWLRQSASIGDVLGRLPNVEIAGGPRAAGQVTAVRGFTGRQVTTLLNGARMNGDRSTLIASFFMDPSLLRSAEVIRGSTSSLYGTGGMGGVVSFRTVTALDQLEPGRRAGVRVTGGFADANDDGKGLLQAYGRTGSVDGLVAVSYDTWAPIRQGGGTFLTPNDGHGTNALVSSGWQAGERRLSFTHHSYREKNFRSNNPQADSTFPFMQMNHTDQHVTTVTLEDRRVHATVYRSQLDTLTEANAAISQPESSTGFTTWGAALQHATSFASPVGRHSLIYGFDVFRDAQVALANGVLNSINPKGTQLAAGVFAQDEIAFGTRWFVTPSVRWDRFSNRPADTELGDTNQTSSSPKVSVAWAATPALRLYTSVGRGFRAPSLTEIYQFSFVLTNLSNFSPNPDLRSERSVQYEGGVSWQEDGVFGSADRLTVRGSVFGTRDTDLITSTVIGTYRHPALGIRPIQQFQNIAKASRPGAELTATYTNRGADVILNYSVIRVTDRTTGNGLYSPPDKGVVTLGYTIKRLGARLAWTTTAARAQDYDATVARRRAGYVVHDLLSTWAPGSGRIRVDAGITNLFDKRYTVYKLNGTYTNAPEVGRNATVRATLIW